MSYRATKISFDGSHYIATPKENFPQGLSDDGQAVRYLLKKQKRKSNSKPLTGKAKSCPAKNAKPICGRLWRKLSPTRSKGKNASSGTTNVRKSMLYAEKCV